MPYIKPVRRPFYDELLEPVARHLRLVCPPPGDCNYLITRLVLAMLPDRPTYDDYERIVGRLDLVKDELKRRLVAPYEDKKIAENGDVYP